MYTVTIDAEKCDGCGECADNCPVEMFAVADGKSTIVLEMSECTGCETCVAVCPNECITVEEY